MSMEPELKAKWIEALRSDAYDQNQGALCTDNGYCCLGVLFCGLLKGPARDIDLGEPLGMPTTIDMLGVGLDGNIADALSSINDRQIVDWDDIPEPVKAALEYEEEGDCHEGSWRKVVYYQSDFEHIAAAIEAWGDL